MKKTAICALAFLALLPAFSRDWQDDLAAKARNIMENAAMPRPLLPLDILPQHDRAKMNFRNSAGSNQFVMAVKADDGEILFSSFVGPNESFEVPNRPNLTLYLLTDMEGFRFPPTMPSHGNIFKPIDLKTIEKQAERGNPFAQLVSGGYYLRGENVQPDYGKAYRLFSNAAEKGNPAAMLALSQMFRDGAGVKNDEIKSFELANAAVSFNYTPAYTYVGYAYAKGIGVEKNTERAIRYLKQGVASGDDTAMLCLFEIYLKELKDEKSAAVCLDMAIKRGNRFADEIKGDLILKEAADDTQKLEAVKHYLDAAARNSPTAAFKIARLEREGLGNLELAYRGRLSPKYAGMSSVGALTDMNLRYAERRVLEAYRLNPVRGFYSIARLYAPFNSERCALNMAYAYSLMDEFPQALGDNEAREISIGTVEYLIEIRRDAASAIDLCEKTYAEFKNVEPLVELAKIHSNRMLGVFDPEKALEYCKKAQEAGYDHIPLKARILAAKNDYATIEKLYMESGDSEDPELIFKMASDIDPFYTPEELSGNRRNAKLNEWYARAAKLKHPDSISRLGEYYEFEKNDLAKAVEHYEQAAALSPSSEGALNLARLYAQGKFFDLDKIKAAEFVKKWNEKTKGEKTLKELNLLRSVNMRLGSKPVTFMDDLKASTAFMNLVRAKKPVFAHAPRTPEYRQKLKLAVEELDKIDGIIESGKDAAYIYDETAEMYEYLLNDSQTAKKYRLRAQEFDPGFSEARLSRINGAQARDPLESFLTSQKNRSRNDGDVYLNAAILAKHLGEFEKHFEYANTSAAKGSNEGKVMLGRAYLYGIGTPSDPDRAEKVFLECANIKNLSDNLAYYAAEKLVEIYLSKGDTEKAKKVFAKADRSLYLKSSANFYAKLKDFKKTYEILREWDSVSPNAEAKIRMAEMSLYGKGVEADADNAFRLYSEAVRTNPSPSEGKIANVGMVQALIKMGKPDLANESRARFSGIIKEPYYEGFYTGNPDIEGLFKLANEGSIYAMNMLGMYCLKIQKDHARARAWFWMSGSDFEMSKTQAEQITKEEIESSKKLLWEIFDSPQAAVGTKKAP